MSVPTLPEGYRVKYYHQRKLVYKFPEQIISPCGGTTVAKILDSDGNEVATGRAECNNKDSYNKKIGRDISLGRALKELENASLPQVSARSVDH